MLVYGFASSQKNNSDGTERAIRRERNSMRSGASRRTALKTAAHATTALVAAPYVRGAHAAGKISIGFWDHWVPNANKATEAIVNAWAAKEKVEVQMDFIPSQGDKNLITIAAEAQARSGHDIFAFPTWYCQIGRAHV